MRSIVTVGILSFPRYSEIIAQNSYKPMPR